MFARVASVSRAGTRRLRGACRSLVLLAVACGPKSQDTTTDGGTTAQTTEPATTASTTPSSTTSPTSTSTTGGTTDVATTGDVPDPTSTTSTSTSTSTSTTSTTGEPPPFCFDTDATTGDPDITGGDDETTGGPVQCPPVEGLPCTAPIDCTDFPCGTYISGYDEHGCPRRPCEDDAECAADEECRNSVYEGLAECVEQDGVCSCAPGMNFEPGVCVPKKVIDVASLCPTLTDQAACDRFSFPNLYERCLWTEIEQLCPGACASRTVHRCIHWSYHGNGCFGHCEDLLTRGYTREGEFGPELIVTQICEHDPVGWEWCPDSRNAEICDCACD
ncbi:hypothetical protein OV203_35950 [Nannocystis sp. ILAH1]|uniref:hypothetical protein n=1 Tax=unclassified Nannocystis TaxID=2627009 RepID=UPI002270D612|nr:MULTISPECIES: hypothetical protein [unclassified Nannocystis]MCY0992589.1 hypothetical protein [Nannocystis sp. ILAH1]MCY1070185.1 hypothetical protein [Nannocystis sp. RBIL2]